MADDGTVKITDFGVSHIFDGDDDTLGYSAGSPAFLAPELCTQGFKCVASGKAVDIWASGITLYHMLVGHVPFMNHNNNLLQLYDSIRLDPVTIPDHISPEPRELLIHLLDKDPKTRYTIPQVMVGILSPDFVFLLSLFLLLSI